MMMPVVQGLASDSSHYVRSALAGVVLELAPRLGKGATLEMLLPLCLDLLRDEYPEVRLAIISKLDQVNQVSWAPEQHVKTTIALRFAGLNDCSSRWQK